MKKRNVIFYLVWLIVLVIFQPTLMQGIRILGVSPDMFLVFVVCAGLLRGRGDGAVIGFIFGLVFDLLVGEFIGISAILYMYIGLSAGIIKERFVSDRLFVAVLVIASSALVYGIIYYIVYYIGFKDLGFGTALLRTVLPKTLYTALAGFILFVPIRKSFKLIEDKMF